MQSAHIGEERVKNDPLIAAPESEEPLGESLGAIYCAPSEVAKLTAVKNAAMDLRELFNALGVRPPLKFEQGRGAGPITAGGGECCVE
jgi:catalase (peroxidase I)